MCRVEGVAGLFQGGSRGRARQPLDLLHGPSAQATETRPCAPTPGGSSASFMHWWGSRCLGSFWQGSGTGWAPPYAAASVTSKPSFW